MSCRRLFVLLVVWFAGAHTGWGQSGSQRDVFTYQGWRDEVEAKGLNPDDVVYPFQTSPEMISWADQVTAGGSRLDPQGRLAELQRAIFDPEGSGFVYDDSRSLTAVEAFHARRGNCMSFTALFIAMSRSLGIRTHLLEVRREPEIDRQDGLVVVNRHVVAAFNSGTQTMMFDFNLNPETPITGWTVVDDVHASAMHHNNQGAIALREGRLEDAVRHVGIATSLAPKWPAGWVNLGVALSRRDDVEGAYEAYRRALELDPKNPSALNNLSILYERLGRHAEARVALEAAARRGKSPFVLIALADSEMLSGEMQVARKYLNRAKRLEPDEPEVWDALARLARRTGEKKLEVKYRRRAEMLRSTASEPN